MSDVPPQWHMYVVECGDGSFYCGITTDLQRRLNEHNTSDRGAKYTRARRPVKLIYSEPHPDRSSASIAEAFFKRLSRIQKVDRVRGGA
jgi:putative endonuclease